MLTSILLLFLTPVSLLGHPLSSWTSELILQLQQTQDAIIEDAFTTKSSSPVVEELSTPEPSSPSIEDIATSDLSSPFVEDVSTRGATCGLVYQFKDETRAENIAVRRSGSLLLSIVNQPMLYQLDPNTLLPRAELVYKFPKATGMTGIIETSPDIFAIVSGNWSMATFTATPGSFKVWSVDFNQRQPAVKMIASLPGAAGLNGMTAVRSSPGIVLIADSAAGAVWRLDVATGESKVAFQSPMFTNATGHGPLAINGMEYFENKLYFTNSALNFYGRIPLTNDGYAAGEVEVLARARDGVQAFDDFAIDWAGNGWLATHANMVTEITVEGKQRNFTADIGAVDIAHPTSAAFGKGSPREEKTLYITTAGDFKNGGQVFKLDTCNVRESQNK